MCYNNFKFFIQLYNLVSQKRIFIIIDIIYNKIDLW